MREREMLKVTKCVRVNSFVGALIDMVCELKVISEKQCYAAMKYIVIERNLLTHSQ